MAWAACQPFPASPSESFPAKDNTEPMTLQGVMPNPQGTCAEQLAGGLELAVKAL